MAARRQPLERPCPSCYAPASTVPEADPEPKRPKPARVFSSAIALFFEPTDYTYATCAACGSPAEPCMHCKQLRHRFAFPDMPPTITARVCRDHTSLDCQSCQRSYRADHFTILLNFHNGSANLNALPHHSTVHQWKRVGFFGRLTGDTTHTYGKHQFTFGSEPAHVVCDHCFTLTTCALCHRAFSLSDPSTGQAYSQWLAATIGEEGDTRATAASRRVFEGEPITRRCTRCGSADTVDADELGRLKDLARE